MGSTNIRKEMRFKRKKRIRKKVMGSGARPRLSVFRSARHIYAQVIDDATGQTMASACTLEKDARTHGAFDDKKAAAAFVGKLVGERAMEKGIKSVVFDRNGFLYHGRVKALSDGARKTGLDF
ncbi:MAG: 50S ribosomal protein L18 [Deltaproteobacteria bacterium]|nr:50S ribosomal protein L18 [Deltaproteobacteria bacterium]